MVKKARLKATTVVHANGKTSQQAERSILDVATLVRGVSFREDEVSGEARPNFVPLLRATNIAEELDLNDVVYVPTSRVSPEQLLKVGDVVVAMSSGSKAVVGKAASLKGPWLGTVGAFCSILRPNDDLDWRFFSYFFQTRRYKHSIFNASAGVNINNLGRKDFANIQMPVPPLAEQKQIADKLDLVLGRLKATERQLSTSIAKVRSAEREILNRALFSALSPIQSES